MMPKRDDSARKVNVSGHGLTLGVSTEDQKLLSLTSEEGEATLSKTLFVSSENGFIVKGIEGEFKRDALHGSFVCDVPYSICTLKI